MKCRWLIRFDENGNKEKVLQQMIIAQREDFKGNVFNQQEWEDVVTVDFTKDEDN